MTRHTSGRQTSSLGRLPGLEAPHALTVVVTDNRCPPASILVLARDTHSVWL